jgi:hypothetical protein
MTKSIRGASFIISYLSFVFALQRFRSIVNYGMYVNICCSKDVR